MIDEIENNVDNNLEINNFDIENSERNYYASFMEKIGFTKIVWIMFTLASLLQWIWGSETCFISINMDFLGKNKEIKQSIISLCVCLLYSMMGIGAALVGILCNKLGRIYTLNLSIYIYVIATILCSLIPKLNFYIILFLRCLSNINVGIMNIVVLNLLCEFLPIKYRSLILMINSGFYNFGNLFTILLNNYMLDVEIFNDYYWKIVNVILIIPGILSLIIIVFWGSESPLYLLNKNNLKKGFTLIEYMMNRLLTDNEKEKLIYSIKCKKNYKLSSNYSELFTKDYIFLTIGSLIICSICYLNMIGITYLIPKTLQDLGDSIYNLSYYYQIFIYGIIQLPNGFIGGFMTESKVFGRKVTIWISALFCAMFYFISFFNMKYVAIYAGIIMLFNSICYGVAFIYISEIFPTNLRDNAQSFIQCFSFFLGSWSPYVVDAFPYKYSYGFFGFSNIIIVVIALMFPIETHMRPLDEDISKIDLQ
jgi:MFS family permease